MRTRIMAVAVLLAGSAVPGTIPPACAQVVDPLQNPSVRSAGMGGPSAAVVWSGDLNTWANPALLGYASGLTLRWSRADLTYFAPPVRFRAGAVAYGWGGVGLFYGHDGIRLDAALTDPFGNPLPPGKISQRVRRWGGAISVSHLLETVLGDASLPGIVRYADLALGVARKRGDFRSPFVPGGTWETAGATDLGLLACVTPLRERSGRRLFLDLAYGYSVLEEPFYRSTEGVTPDHRRHGIGVRIRTPLAAGDPAGDGRRLVDRLARGGRPTLGLTVAADFDRFEDPGLIGGWRSRTSRDIGAELDLANALAVRFGHIRDEVQDLDSFCFGVGIGAPIASYATVRYDYARFPSSGFDGDTPGDRHSVSVWIDPIAMVRR